MFLEVNQHHRHLAQLVLALGHQLAVLIVDIPGFAGPSAVAGRFFALLLERVFGPIADLLTPHPLQRAKPVLAPVHDVRRGIEAEIGPQLQLLLVAQGEDRLIGLRRVDKDGRVTVDLGINSRPFHKIVNRGGFLVHIGQE